MNQRFSPLVLALVLIAAVVAVSWLLSSPAEGKKNPQNRAIDPDISAEDTRMFTDDDALFSYVWKYGPKRTVEHLYALSTTYGFCHDTAHRTGHFSYEVYGDESFRLCSAECHSGCYHGATEAYFREHGTANLTESLSTICGGDLNSFFTHQCFHGIGHGLMAWANYEIFDALHACDLLEEPYNQNSCWTGVFMENIVGTLGKLDGHTTKYLSDDPHFPCNIVDEKYKGSCYFLQTSHMLVLFGEDFERVARVCSEAPQAYQKLCFDSMGRDVSGANRGNIEAAVAACQHAPVGEYRTACLAGVAQDLFWDPSGQDTALRFCTLLGSANEKEACYRIIFERAPEVLASEEERESFCAKAEGEYQLLCRSFIDTI